MSKVKARIEVPYAVSAAEALWYDQSRWPNFVDGFGAIATGGGDWPHTGARVIWDSRPGGRGRVVERVLAYEPRVSQVVHVEDEQLQAEQTVSFEPTERGAVVAIVLDYSLKKPGPLSGVTDLLFIRRAMRDSLQRTLHHFAYELRGDHEL